MIIDYILSEKKKVQLTESKHIKHVRRINENDPTQMLRDKNIKIKRIIPKEKYIEVYLFDDIKNIDLDSILGKFYYKVDYNENKILIGYNIKD